MTKLASQPVMGKEVLRSCVARLICLTDLTVADVQAAKNTAGLPESIANVGLKAAIELGRAKERLLKFLQGVVTHEDS